MDRRTLFWDVDTQYDFMMPDGKLYAQGADQIIPMVNELRAMAFDRACSMVASVDWHSPDNPEISDRPDFDKTFPAHCIAGTPGAERVGLLGKWPIDIIDVEPRNPGELAELVQKDPFHLVIRKNAISVFSNPNTAVLVETINPGTIIVFGMVLEFCVQDTLRGLARFPDIQLVLVRDATAALDAGAEARVLNELQRMGVDVTESSLISELAPCG